ncbi:MAG: calcium/sodium antiporter [Phycisphaeraceae bacterium]|nr:calcium/sodium antiporter [Phycisphaeraceae bacterium]
MLDLLTLVFGLALLIGGAELLVRGASGLAKALRVAPVLVGLTVVAFGTSTPELVVNLVAAYRGEQAIGFGNVVGSNIANIGLLLGITGLLRPIAVHGILVRREIPMMVLGTVLVIVQAEDQWLTGRGSNTFERDDGLSLLLLFCVFLYYTVSEAVRGGGHDQGVGLPVERHDDTTPRASAALAKLSGLIILGLAILVVGGELTVRGATGFARSLGVSEVIIGLTIVAVGTSLPELATNLVAIFRKEGDMAIGNIVGSNIFNLLFVFGVTASIAPVPLPPGGMVDLAVMTAFSLALVPMALVGRSIGRGRAGLLLLGYAGYVTWLALR